jgi:AbrB family looped-hinge helix DNA binding protein
MIEITKMSSKGQVVIPMDIRKELELEEGSVLAISKVDDCVMLKKVEFVDVKKKFEELTKWGEVFAKKKGIKSEEDVMRIIKRGK